MSPNRSFVSATRTLRYNAAKHGFALQGERSRLTTTVDDVDVIDEEGLTIEWLAIHAQPPRWTRPTRWFSAEATIALAFMASQMMRALWIAACERYLREKVEEEFSPLSHSKAVSSAATAYDP